MRSLRIEEVPMSAMAIWQQLTRRHQVFLRKTFRVFEQLEDVVNDIVNFAGLTMRRVSKANIHSTNYCTRLRSIIQSVSHVLPPSVDSACSQ